jgi:hypothetical protein
MNANNYWLVSIDEEEVNVSLVLFDDIKSLELLLANQEIMKKTAKILLFLPLMPR